MSDQITPEPGTPDEALAKEARSRRFLIGTIGGILLIGIVGVVIAISSSSDDSSTPIAVKTLDPLSVEGVCRSAHVATYAVAGKVQPASFTVTAEVKPWLRKDETSQTTNVNDTTSLAALGSPGAPPREVLTLSKNAAGWTIVQTGACLDAKKKATACPADVVLTVAGKTYAEELTGNGTTLGAVVGQGSLTPCQLTGSKKVLLARGVVAPVTAFRGQVSGSLVLDLGNDDYAQYGAKQ